MEELPLKIGDYCRYFQGVRYVRGKILDHKSGCFYVKFNKDIWKSLPGKMEAWIYADEVEPIMHVKCPEYMKEYELR